MSISIIIPKSNKTLYDSLKFFHPIMLLNMLGKLIEKVIRDRMQFHPTSSNFIYSNQLGELKQYSTLDVGIFLTYLI